MQNAVDAGVDAITCLHTFFLLFTLNFLCSLSFIVRLTKRRKYRNMYRVKTETEKKMILHERQDLCIVVVNISI